MKLRNIVLLAFLTLTKLCFAQSKTATMNGNWNNPAVWSPSGVPTQNDIVTIPQNFTVTLNTNGSSLELSF